LHGEIVSRSRGADQAGSPITDQREARAGLLRQILDEVGALRRRLEQRQKNLKLAHFFRLTKLRL